LPGSGYSEEMAMKRFDTGNVIGFMQIPSPFEQLKLKMCESPTV
jgi:hypothetical protein